MDEGINQRMQTNFTSNIVTKPIGVLQSKENINVRFSDKYKLIIFNRLLLDSAYSFITVSASDEIQHIVSSLTKYTIVCEYSWHYT